MKRIIITVVIFFITRGITYAQAVALDRLGKDKWFKYAGGISAMGVFYNGAAPRDPLGYMVRGNLDITLAGIYRFPFSFTYSDQGLRFPSPIKLNRFSFHPSYKGLQLHFGDAALSFSPYTLSGHQFTGFGAEYKSSKPWTLAVMYGRLLKQVAYNGDQLGIQPVHERKGYGLKVGYKQPSWGVSAVLFSARDQVDTSNAAIEKYPFPERNIVMGMQGRLTVLEKGELTLDYSQSMIGLEKEGLKVYQADAFPDSLFVDNARRYRALKFGMNYPAFSGNLSVIYERIDPGYRTFGAYYFNSDLENISVVVRQSIFNRKVDLQLRSGVQRDNLDRAKNSEFRRLVNAIDVAYTPTEAVNLNVHYSNFLTHTNSRDQFDRINQVSSLDVVDTLQYRQLAQQAALSMQYRTSANTGSARSWSLMLNLQENRNENNNTQTGVTGDYFYQGALHYLVQSRPAKMQYGFSCNASWHDGGPTHRFTWGPGINAGKQLLNKKLRTRLTVNYNFTDDHEGRGGQVFNSRLQASWMVYQRHQLGFSGGYQYRTLPESQYGDLTLQINYQYRFDNFRLQLQSYPDRIQSHHPQLAKVRFRYRDVLYSGTLPEVNRQLALVSREPQFIALPQNARRELERLKDAYLEQDKRAGYKFHALHYLATLYHYGDAIEAYYHEADMAIRKIIFDMKGTDYELERRYVKSRNRWERANKEVEISGEAEKRTDPEHAYLECLHRLKGHRWLEKELKAYSGLSFDTSVHPVIRTYLATYLQDYINALAEGMAPESLRAKIEIGLIDHFYRSSFKYTVNAGVQLRYHNFKSK